MLESKFSFFKKNSVHTLFFIITSSQDIYTTNPLPIQKTDFKEVGGFMLTYTKTSNKIFS